MTKQSGVDVWPNAAIWMRDELRSKVRLLCNMSQAFYTYRYKLETGNMPYVMQHKTCYTAHAVFLSKQTIWTQISLHTSTNNLITQ